VLRKAEGACRILLSGMGWVSLALHPPKQATQAHHTELLGHTCFRTRAQAAARCSLGRMPDSRLPACIYDLLQTKDDSFASSAAADGAAFVDAKAAAAAADAAFLQGGGGGVARPPATCLALAALAVLGAMVS